MKPLCGSIAALVVFVSLVPVCKADDGPYADLLRRLPDSTNVLVIADAQGLRSALGVAPGTKLANGELSSLPVMANKFVMGAHVDLTQRTHLWSIALCQLSGKISIQDFAKLENEPVAQVGDYPTVASQRNAYFIELGPQLLGCRTPANRQELSRWLRYQKSNPLVALPPNLLQAANPSDPALIVMAIDLADSLDPLAIHRGLNFSKVMASRRQPDYNGVAKTLGQAQGMILTVRSGTPLSGVLTVNFSTNTEAIRPFAKSLLIEILQKTDLYVQDFDDWEPQLKEKSIGLQGPLSLNALRKFGALIKTPAPAPQAADMDSYRTSDPGERAVTTSKRYFANVSQLLSDLKADKTRSLKGLAGWYDQYADQIDKFPILDVDPQLIGYAAATTQHLRAMGASLKGIALESGYLQSQKRISSYNGYYGYYGYGLAGYQMSMGATMHYREIQDTLVTQGAQARADLWQRIDTETAEIRRQMTIKYKTEF